MPTQFPYGIKINVGLDPTRGEVVTEVVLAGRLWGHIRSYFVARIVYSC